MTSEFALIDAIARRVRRARVHTRGVVVGIGDDAAVLRVSVHEDLVVTTDTLVEGRHFERGWLSSRAIGWRLAAVNLSDIAAMGATPRFALVSLVLPRHVRAASAEQIEAGAIAHLARHGAVVVGGNVASTRGALVCEMTLVGVCRRGRAWRRRARAGDAIVVVGALGAAAAGVVRLKRGVRRGSLVGAYRRPTPRLATAAVLAGNPDVHGAVDVSDGLSSDVIHVCEASRLGCDVNAEALPVARDVRRFCAARGRSPIEWALHAGEDYALVLSVAPKRAGEVCRILERAGEPAVVVGRFTARPGRYRLVEGGRARRFEPGGWDHLKA
jgi:thiamine-monophosphate kinase